MSLQKKIEQEMSDLAIRIIRHVQYSQADVKVRKLCKAYFDLKRLLTMANSVVEIDIKASKVGKDNVESEQV